MSCSSWPTASSSCLTATWCTRPRSLAPISRRWGGTWPVTDASATLIAAIDARYPRRRSGRVGAFRGGAVPSLEQVEQRLVDRIVHVSYPIGPGGAARPDRKSTRLNSSHDQISYAVFCLKKKTSKRSRRLHR